MRKFLGPEFASLDEKMQTGYKLQRQKDLDTEVCKVWLEAWSDFLDLYDKLGTTTIKEFDHRFNGTQSVSNWVQDLESALWNVGLDDPHFLTERVTLCQLLLQKFGDDGETLRNENTRRSLAECYARLQQQDKADALFDDWLKKDTHWGWGWIGWADCYIFGQPDAKNLEKAEQLLRQGLAIAAVRDRIDIMERLANVLDELGKGNEADELRLQIKQELSSKPQSIYDTSSTNPAFEKMLQALCSPQAASTFDSLDTSSAFENKHRPCQCGSGKKFKKCCGRGLKY